MEGKRLLRVLKLRPILGGLKSWLPRVFPVPGTGGADSARYCYAVWMRHLLIARQHGLAVPPATILEIGPGDSLGVGLAGLISGAGRYYALDAVDYTAVSGNLRVFDELLDLFRRREKIPGKEEFPLIEPDLADDRFPENVLGDLRVDDPSFAEKRARIENSLKYPGDSGGLDPIISASFSYGGREPEAGTIDLVIAQSSLEMVGDLRQMYQNIHRWLSGDGLASMQITFSAQWTAKVWNGHWSYPDFVWKLMRGRRTYFLNRQPLSTHLRILEETGFETVELRTTRGEGGIGRKQLAPSCSWFSDGDLQTMTAYILARRAR